MKSWADRSWLLLGGIWTSILLLPVGRSAWIDTLGQEYLFYLGTWVVGVGLYPFQLKWLSKIYDTNRGWRKIILIQLSVGLILASLYYVYSSQTAIISSPIIMPGGDWQGITARPASFRFISGDPFSVFYLYCLQGSIAVLFVYNGKLKEKELIEATLQSRLTTSQLKVLQSELQPHFFFNTLHAINNLMEENVEQAQLLVEKLANLLRHYLSIITKPFYSVQEEISFLEEFVEVHQIRHDGQIDLRVDTDGDSEPVLVPVIFLQPLIENSVKYARPTAARKLEIFIRIRCHERRLHIVVGDNGKNDRVALREGVGLRNLRERLQVLYGGDFRFVYQLHPEGFKTEIEIPVSPAIQFSL